MGHPHACAGACRYVKRKGGCREGADCSQCHLCFWRRRDSKPVPSEECPPVPSPYRDVQPQVLNTCPRPSANTPSLKPAHRQTGAPLQLSQVLTAPSPSQKMATLPTAPPPPGAELQFLMSAPPGLDIPVVSGPVRLVANVGDESATHSDSEFGSDASTKSSVDFLARPKPITITSKVNSSPEYVARESDDSIRIGSYIPGSILRSMVQM